MKHVKQSAKPLSAALALILCFTISACGQPERPRTVSDFCLAAKRISAEPHPGGPGKDDPGNRYDTEQTFGEVVEHNAAYDKLCPSPSS